MSLCFSVLALHPEQVRVQSSAVFHRQRTTAPSWAPQPTTAASTCVCVHRVEYCMWPMVCPTINARCSLPSLCAWRLFWMGNNWTANGKKNGWVFSSPAGANQLHTLLYIHDGGYILVEDAVYTRSSSQRSCLVPLCLMCAVYRCRRLFSLSNNDTHTWLLYSVCVRVLQDAETAARGRLFSSF
jgi:hypothetical protein